MTELWISWTDEDGNEGSARWSGPSAGITDKLIDYVLFDVQRRLGAPDTIV